MTDDPISSHAGQRAKRDSVFRSARVSIEEPQRDLTCRVRNISATGSCINHKGELSGGMIVRIAIGREPEVVARVMWASENLAGLAFAGEQGVPDAPAGSATPTAGWLAERTDAYRW